MPVDDIGFAFGIAGMVDESGGVPFHIAVDIMLIVERKDIHGTLLAVAFLSLVPGDLVPAVGFPFGNFLSNIFNYYGIRGDIFFRENAGAMYF